jgi:hypothetical protein
MFKLKAGGLSWCELWVPRIINAKLTREESFRERYAAELAIIESCGWPLVALAALYWKYKNDAYFDYRDQGLPVLAISYDDLVADPRPVLESVCRHLGTSFHSNLLRHGELGHSEFFVNGLTVGNTDPKRPIQTDSVGQWQRFLSKEDLRLIDCILGSMQGNITFPS